MSNAQKASLKKSQQKKDTRFSFVCCIVVKGNFLNSYFKSCMYINLLQIREREREGTGRQTRNQECVTMDSFR